MTKPKLSKEVEERFDREFKKDQEISGGCADIRERDGKKMNGILIINTVLDYEIKNSALKLKQFLAEEIETVRKDIKEELLEGIEVWKALQGIFYDAFNYGKKGTCTKEQRQKVIEKALERFKQLLK